MSGPRVLAFNALFLTFTLVLGLAGLVVRTCRRDLAFPLARFWTRGTVGLLCAICRVRIEVSGREHLVAGPLIVASQHRSALDALIWFSILDRPSYVMKRELERLPLIGPLLEPAGMIPVDRAGGSQALRCMLRHAAAALGNGRQLIIFPEGTRIPSGGQEAPLAPGIAALARCGVPILPVATDSDRVWGPGLLLRPAHMPAAAIVRIAVGPPLPSGLDRDRLIIALRAAWHAVSCG